MNDTETVRLGDKARDAGEGLECRNNKGESRSSTLQAAPLLQIFLSFLKIGAFTFGGGWAMVPLIRKELVDRQGWLEDSEFVDILAIAQSGPGPIAINTSVLCGYKMRGVPGSLIATLGSSLPSFLIILIVANFFLRIRDSKAVEAIFKGMRPAIFGLLISAVWHVGKKSIKNRKDIVFAVAGAAILLYLKINPIFAVLTAAVSGIIYGLVERSRVNQRIGKTDHEAGNNQGLTRGLARPITRLATNQGLTRELARPITRLATNQGLTRELARPITRLATTNG